MPEEGSFLYCDQRFVRAETESGKYRRVEKDFKGREVLEDTYVRLRMPFPDVGLKG